MSGGPRAAMAASTLYEHDFYAWTREQAAALRRLAATRWNGPLDLENLAEEIEGLARGERGTCESQIERLLQHFLKLEYSPSPEPRRQWLIKVFDTRDELARHLTAVLRRDIGPNLALHFRRARRKAHLELLDRGERDAADALPTENPYSLDLLLDEAWYPANRHGLVDEI